MAYAIYETADRLVVIARLTQTAANAAVTALGAGHATIEVDDGKSGHELPANFAPGFMYVTVRGVLVAEPISGAIAKREATFGALAQLELLGGQSECPGQGPAIRNSGAGPRPSPRATESSVPSGQPMWRRQRRASGPMRTRFPGARPTSPVCRLSFRRQPELTRVNGPMVIR